MKIQSGFRNCIAAKERKERKERGEEVMATGKNMSALLPVESDRHSLRSLAANFGVRVQFSTSRSQRALTLVECTVYMAIFCVVLGLAFAAFYRVETNTRALSRNAADIVRAIQAGERWREELRGSVGVWLDVQSVLHVTRTNGEICYDIWDNQVWRQVDGARIWTPFLTGVKSSRMIADPREHVTAWRWELELQTAQKVARVRPLFSFEAVAPAAKQP